jgi:hypothetical protein
MFIFCKEHDIEGKALLKKPGGADNIKYAPPKK